jgi:hypothetical protein
VATGRERIRLGEVYYGQTPAAEHDTTSPASPDVDAASST